MINNSLYKTNIENQSVYVDFMVYDSRNNIKMISLIGYYGAISTINYIKEYGGFNVNNERYYILGSHEKQVRQLGENLYQLTIMSKERRSVGLLSSFYAVDKNDDKKKALFNHAYDKLDVPMIEEWSDFIFDALAEEDSIRELNVFCINPKYKDYSFYEYTIHESLLISAIEEGISQGFLTLGDNDIISEDFKNIQGLDDYLELFSENIANQIESSFTPKFIPGVDKYSKKLMEFSKNAYDNGIRLFDEQKNVIQAISNNLDVNNVTFLVGEMGTGKTIMGAAIPYVHSKDTYSTSIVMCPSHLVNKWQREIENNVPNSKGYIIEDYTDVIELDKVIRNKERGYHLYLIVSKDKAKSNYDKRPTAIWDNHEKVFRCPKCGDILIKKVSNTSAELGFDDMIKEYKYNQKCSNNECRTPLWSILNKDEEIDWIKISRLGWIHEDSINHAISELSFVNTSKGRKELAKLIKTRKEIEDGTVRRFFRASSKYAISTYIKKYYKGQIDYLIADEVHLLKGQSLQGESFDDLVKASNKLIALTGTLLNGYADSIFYLLYRTMPRLMQKEGFGFNDVNEFIRRYGVMSQEVTTVISEDSSEDVRKTRNKKLPGISPVIFTKFLLDNSVFLTLSDMAEGLPGYSEHPIGIKLEYKVDQYYKEIEDLFIGLNKEEESNEDRINRRAVAHSKTKLLQLMGTYPDEPYNNEPIYNENSNSSLSEGLYFKPKDIFEENIVNYKNNKLEKTVEIVKDKVSKGERVLVFVTWTNSTGLETLIKERLTQEGFNASIMKNVAPNKREEWISKKVKEGMDVMICNPKLVETGLDLLDFTSIIFYQIGYDIYTMRQASRRSWRLSQDKDIDVYFLYYENTVQEKTLSMMARKLKASMAIEGNFSEEGLRALSDNTDLMSEVANSIINDIESKVELGDFTNSKAEVETSKVRYKRKRLKFNKERYYAHSQQKKSVTRRFFENLLKQPIKAVNML